MSVTRDLQDFAFRHLRDYVDTCRIIKVYATADPVNFVVVIDNESYTPSMASVIWRALQDYPVDVVRSDTEVKIPITEKTFVCYQSGRWIR